MRWSIGRGASVCVCAMILSAPAMLSGKNCTENDLCARYTEINSTQLRLLKRPISVALLQCVPHHADWHAHTSTSHIAVVHFNKLQSAPGWKFVACTLAAPATSDSGGGGNCIQYSDIPIPTYSI